MLPLPGHVLQSLRGRVLVLRRAALGAPRAHGRYVGLPPLLDGAVGLGRELDEGVQGHIHPGALGLVLLHEVCVDAAQDGLVGDDEDVLATLELHDDGLETDDDVAVRFAAAVSVVVLVIVAGGEVLGEAVLDLLVCQAIADAGIELVQGLPLQLIVVRGEEASRGDGAF